MSQRLTVLLSASLLFASACAEPESRGAAPAATKTETATPKVEHVDVARAAELVKADPDLVILDVRTPPEFESGHLENARNIDFKAQDFTSRIGELPREPRYLVYCRSGRRSTAALKLLGEAGFQDLVHMDGGMLDWSAKKLPTVK